MWQAADSEKHFLNFSVTLSGKHGGPPEEEKQAHQSEGRLEATQRLSMNQALPVPACMTLTLLFNPSGSQFLTCKTGIQISESHAWSTLCLGTWKVSDGWPRVPPVYLITANDFWLSGALGLLIS